MKLREKLQELPHTFYSNSLIFNILPQSVKKHFYTIKISCSSTVPPLLLRFSNPIFIAIVAKWWLITSFPCTRWNANLCFVRWEELLFPNFAHLLNGGGFKQETWQADGRESRELEKPNTGSTIILKNLMGLLWFYVDINILWIVQLHCFAHTGRHSSHHSPIPHISFHICHSALLYAEETWYKRINAMG